MATTKIHIINTHGKTVPFTNDKIKAALIGRNAGTPEHWGEAHVWAEDPIMVCIHKVRNTKRGPFYYVITETDENSRGKLIDIVNLEFKNDELDEAIETFMRLCQRPKKKPQNKLIKRMGGHVIFLHDIATESSVGQTRKLAQVRQRRKEQ